ncbi:histidinol-phosphate/aromatic aminotransferase/cobyric acid decarboxylase-like protein [Nitrobacteraceae bacterium AZCC 2146]
MHKLLRSRRIRLGLRGICSSDRVVRLDHNSPKYAEAKQALETLEKLLQETNDYPDPEDKEQKIAEISAARRLLQAVRVRVKAIVAVVGAALLYLASAFMTSGIGTAAKIAWEHILALLGVS